ncbi:MAG: hypothetical protein FD146_1110 [Anaerolineaceae bacterium]|nr:MAG: hypothetical protein FD146_1110 [Anaerolineaceae bacterium]
MMPGASLPAERTPQKQEMAPGLPEKALNAAEVKMRIRQID